MVTTGTAQVIVTSLTEALGESVFCPIETTEEVLQPFTVFVATTVNVPEFVNVAIEVLAPPLIPVPVHE
jgi:hypothetical protein